MRYYKPGIEPKKGEQSLTPQRASLLKRKMEQDLGNYIQSAMSDFAQQTGFHVHEINVMLEEINSVSGEGRTALLGVETEVKL